MIVSANEKQKKKKNDENRECLAAQNRLELTFSQVYVEVVQSTSIRASSP